MSLSNSGPATLPGTIIGINQVSYSAGGHSILENISIDLSTQHTAVIGPNGSGKSTFARLLNALILPSSGSVHVNDLDTRASTKAVRRQVGFVFQNPDLQFVMPTVGEDLAFGLKNTGVKSDEIEHRVEQILMRFDLSALRNRTVHTLSGGEKQLLCIAAVLIMQPRIIVFDEPTTLLDLANRRLVNQVISSLEQQTVVVTHDLDYAAQCDAVLLFNGGRLHTAGASAMAVEAYLKLVNAA